jgi:hypothetical protein
LSEVIVGERTEVDPVVVVEFVVVPPSVVVVAASVVAASVVVASVDVAVASVVVEGALVVSADVEVVVELVSESSAENGSPSASALEAITPRMSSATHAAATLPNLLVLLLEFLTSCPSLVAADVALPSGTCTKTTTGRRSPWGSFRVSPPRRFSLVPLPVLQSHECLEWPRPMDGRSHSLVRGAGGDALPGSRFSHPGV